LPTVDTAVECMKLGASEYLQKPLDMPPLVRAVKRGLETRRMRHELALHAAAKRLLALKTGERSFLRRAAEVAEDALQCDTAGIVLSESVGVDVKVRASQSWPLSHLGFQTLSERTMRLLASQSLGAYELDQLLPMQGRRDFHSAVVYPLVSKDELHGALVALRSGEQPPFSGAEYRAGVVFAAQLALAVENNKLVRALEDKIRTLEDTQGRMAASERFAAIGMISSGVAHEINNPASYVLANLGFMTLGLRKLRGIEPLLSGDAPPGDLRDAWQELGGEGFLHDMKEAVEDATEGTERIRGIVADMQTLSQSEREALGRVPVASMVKSAIRISGAGLRNARIVTELAPDLSVFGKAGLLAQVVANLVLNAAQALEEGGCSHREIHVSTRREGDRVVIEVADSGRGMAPEVLSRVFDPFFTTKPVGEGTGLGLPICRDIVSRHKGHIEAISRIGEGTTFRVELPCADPSSGAFLEVAFGFDLSNRAQRPRVLFVEREPVLRRAFTRVFADHFEVSEAESAQAARAALSEDQGFDVIVCSLEAQAGGLELLAWSRSLDEALVDRFVFLWGAASRGSAPPNVPVLAQPVDFDRLLEALRAMVVRDDGQ
jgi:two-component system, cell cycle sensor histidine kinase and response regulator CckA